MVDFKKRLGKNTAQKKINPIEIYESLDRKSDKGPLRPAQVDILERWHSNNSGDKDVIVKLHTGQGKTLIGLLMLQSKLNRGEGPALYLCPNYSLVVQTCEQAEKFGINVLQAEEGKDIPQDFLDSKTIYVATVQKLFNGKSKFGIGKKQKIDVGCIVLDDSHACIDSIQNAFKGIIHKDDDLYQLLLNVFEDELGYQGAATLAEIKKGDNYSAILPVPYWIWQDKESEVLDLFVNHKDSTPELVFAWELLKINFKDCLCIISSQKIEVIPNYVDVNIFSSFKNASHRIFMSATTNNDSFFIKGLGMSATTVTSPLSYNKEKWSGEKMILIPYLMHDDLTRQFIINAFSTENLSRTFGIVAITPSYNTAKLWEKAGAEIAQPHTIDNQLANLKNGNYGKALVIANRYDGIDLPDDSCRILIIDNKPYAQSLAEQYFENVRENSSLIDIRIAQKIEQGFGRGVRGEKDYCVIIISSPDVINKVRNPKLKKFFSAQTNKQIEIGIDVTKYAIEEAESDDGLKTMVGIINQCLKRDDGWKEFYTEKMNEIEVKNDSYTIINILELERRAEEEYLKGNIEKATDYLQEICDKHINNDDDEKGWYLQEMARITYSYSKEESNELQISAHKHNRSLLRPRTGMKFKKLTINKTRIENIKTWINNFSSYEELSIAVLDILSSLTFSSNYEKFENALHKTGIALGFGSERPDKEWKEGPDNLWNVKADEYILFECKNEVKLNREFINKSETGQMNNSCAWFKERFGDVSKTCIMIIPTRKTNHSALFLDDVMIMRKSNLSLFTKNIRNFFNEFSKYELSDLTDTQIETALNTHKLSIEDISSNYVEPPIKK